MEKAKYNEGKNYISILLVPHSKAPVKVLRFSSLYAKVTATIALFIIMLVCAGIFTAYTIKENRILKYTVSQLNNSNLEQRKLLAEKADEIHELKTRDRHVDKQIKDVMDKYKEITDAYISSRTGSGLASRSGERSDRSIVNDINELKNILKSLNELNSSSIADMSVLEETEKKLKQYLDSVPTLWPTSGRISDSFGYRSDPFTRKKTYHDGLDISAPSGQDIKAAASGTVVFSGRRNGYGNMVVIEHGHGISTAYAHASKLLVKEGDKVVKGGVIAKVGSTGRSTGPHLHFEVRLNDSPVDPIKYLE